MNGLLQIGDRMRRQRLRVCLCRVVTRDDDHGKMWPRLGETVVNLEAIHAWHMQIEDYTGWFTDCEGIQEFGTARKGLCFQTSRTHQPQQCAPNGLLVVHDGDE